MSEEKLPRGWSSLPLEEISDFVIGGDWGIDPESEIQEDYVPVACIRGSEIKNWRVDKGKTASIRLIKKSSLEKRQLRLGDLLIEISGGGPDQPVGRVILIDKQAIAQNPELPKIGTNFLRLIRLTDNVNKNFVNYYLQKFYITGKIVEYQGGSNNLRNLKFKEFSKIEIPLPSLPEQQRIVAKLDAVFGHLDSLKEKLDRIPTLLKNFRQQVLTQAVTGELTRDWREGKNLGEWTENLVRILKDRETTFYEKQKTENKKPKKPEYLNYSISDLNESEIIGWAKGPIGLICDSIVPGRDKPKSFTGNIPWVTMPILNSEFINEEDAGLYLSEEEIEEVKAKVIPKGSVVMSIVGRFGIASILNCDAVINQQLHAFLPSPILLPKFLLYQIKTSEKYLNDISTSTTVAYVNKTNANSLPVNIPPIEEQQKIVNRVNSLFELANKIESQYQSLKAKIDQLPQAMLAKAFRGELVGQELKEYVREEGELGMVAENKPLNQYANVQ